MLTEPTDLPGVLILTPARHGDARGWFSETWVRPRLDAAAGRAFDFVQDNQSFSATAFTLRGLHYQRPPRAQAKLVRCTRGRIRDVVVDARAGSPTFGRWTAVELSAADGRQVLVPEGFLHGFVTLEPDCEVQYKCTDTYAPDCDGAVRWDDPDLAVDWGLGTAAPVVSARDAAAPLWRDWATPFAWEGTP